jgi:hypothetical protein
MICLSFIFIWLKTYTKLRLNANWETMTTRGEKICQFIERYCLIPEGSKVGQPIKLLNFQRKFVFDVYDNPAGTSRAYLSVATQS